MIDRGIDKAQAKSVPHRSKYIVLPSHEGHLGGFFVLK
jgi:hypothetical protein